MIEDNDRAGELLRGQLAQLMLQTRRHPELSMEDVRRVAGVSRQCAYELARKAEQPNVL